MRKGQQIICELGTGSGEQPQEHSVVNHIVEGWSQGPGMKAVAPDPWSQQAGLQTAETQPRWRGWTEGLRRGRQQGLDGENSPQSWCLWTRAGQAQPRGWGNQEGRPAITIVCRAWRLWDHWQCLSAKRVGGQAVSELWAHGGSAQWRWPWPLGARMSSAGRHEHFLSLLGLPQDAITG